MKKNIKNIFQKWGNDSQELPEKNSILKEEVLSKVPFIVSEYRRKEKKSVLPYFSLAFVGVAMLFVVINLFPKESKNNFAQNEVINNNKQIAKVLNNDKKESDIVASVKKRIEEDGKKIALATQKNKNTTAANSIYRDDNLVSGGVPVTGMPTSGMPTLSAPAIKMNSVSAPSAPSQHNSITNKNTQSATIFPNLDTTEVSINDTREFLKINYSATLKTRNTVETVKKAEDVVRASGGRVDGASDAESSSYVKFSVPAAQFENFQNQIKGLVNARLFSEEKSVTNMLSKKQDIEAGQNDAQSKISEIKSRKAKIVKNHNEIVASNDDQLAQLEIEVRDLKIEYQKAKPSRKTAILVRLSEITAEENVILLDYDTEDADFSAKVSVVNKELESAGATIDEINAQDVSFTEDIATVDGTLYIEHVNIYEFADAYVPGPLIAWILLLTAGILYIRYRVSQMTIEI